MQLFNVRVTADVIFAVAVISPASGTVTKFQLWIGDVSAAADGALVGVWCLGLCDGCFVGSCIGEGDYLCLPGFFALVEQTGGIDSPGKGNYIQYILAEEEKIVGKGDNGEEVIGERFHKQSINYQCQIHQGENPGLYRDDEHQQETGLGIHGGIGKEQTQIQIADVGAATEDHAPDVHHHNATQIK